MSFVTVVVAASFIVLVPAVTDVENVAADVDHKGFARITRAGMRNSRHEHTRPENYLLRQNHTSTSRSASSQPSGGAQIKKKSAKPYVNNGERAVDSRIGKIKNFDKMSPSRGSNEFRDLKNKYKTPKDGPYFRTWRSDRDEIKAGVDVNDVPVTWVMKIQKEMKDGLETACKNWSCKFTRERNNTRQVIVNCTLNQLNAFLIKHPEAGFDEIEVGLQMFALPPVFSPTPSPASASSALEAATKSDSMFWNLDRIDDRSGNDGTFNAEKNGGSGVHMYIMDTGIRTTHDEFGGRAIPTLDVTALADSGSVTVCDATDTSCADDVDGHGTHCAAIAAGSEGGVAKGATVHAVKILADDGSGDLSWLILGLDWIVSTGDKPAIVSMSIGAEGSSPSTESALDQAAAQGVVVVVAAGNENSDACDFIPASTPSVITVGATDEGDTRSSFSNFGHCLDIFAPGRDITSAGVASDTAFRMLSGTSQACPLVTGVVAILVSSANSTLENESEHKKIVDQLLASATDNVNDLTASAGSDSPHRFLFVDTNDANNYSTSDVGDDELAITSTTVSVAGAVTSSVPGEMDDADVILLVVFVMLTLSCLAIFASLCYRLAVPPSEHVSPPGEGPITIDAQHVIVAR